MVQQRILQFPAGFLWGTASSSYQYEGGNTNNQWYRWEQEGHILSGEQCGEANNWWQNTTPDFDYAEQMENNALRLSIEWSRVEPNEGQWDTAALDRYRAMLMNLKRRGLKPLVTLHHFTDPLWFTERGAFASEANIRFFIRYVTHVVQALQDLCDFWLTINEPNIYAIQGYLTGSFPPGEKNMLLTLQVLHNLISAHVEAFYAIRILQPESMIGYCLHYRLFDPANPFSPLDRTIANVQNTFFNWAILDAAETGHFQAPLNALAQPIAHAAGSRDYHGVNYYTREMVRFDPSLPSELFGRRFVRPGSIHNDPGLDNSFGEIYAEGIYRVLKTIYRRTHGNKPFYITENGFNDSLDDRRPRALLEHLAMIHRAMREGIPVRGYFHWSVTDNFEWNDGWTAHFGLIEFDPSTQQRMPRPSASLFGEICRANAITETIVERFAPEAANFIFGNGNKTQHQIAV